MSIHKSMTSAELPMLRKSLNSPAVRHSQCNKRRSPQPRPTVEAQTCRIPLLDSFDGLSKPTGRRLGDFGPPSVMRHAR